jgi:hypothetical protein
LLFWHYFDSFAIFWFLRNVLVSLRTAVNFEKNISCRKTKIKKEGQNGRKM